MKNNVLDLNLKTERQNHIKFNLSTIYYLLDKPSVEEQWSDNKKIE
jgi:hypothetical protein